VTPAAFPRRRPRLTVAATIAAAAVLAAGCSYVMPASSTAAPPPRPPRTTTTPTTLPPPADATPPPGLGRGDSGPVVLALEQRLAELRYDVGAVDGVFDGTTHHAVMAFQKYAGLARTGRATDDVLAALPAASLPTAMFAEGGPDRVEIDLKRQILMLFQRGELVRILSASTGNEKRYCVDGRCAVAVTPGGSFKVNRKIKGLRVSRLGKLYNPLYFNGGIAIHGSPSVPAGPASHGCVRIPMSASLWFHEAVPLGTPVYVLGGRRAPVPFDEEAPPEVEGAAAPVPPPTTTTTAPPVLGLVPSPEPPPPGPAVPLLPLAPRE